VTEANCLYVLSLLFAVSASAVAAPVWPEPLESVIMKMEQAADRQRAGLCSYSVDRRYIVQNRHLKPNSVMNVHLTYKLGAGKHFETPSLSGVHGLVRRSLLSLLKEEEKTSQEHDQGSRFSAANYDFAPLGLEQMEARTCYRVRLTPRRKSKYLIDGEAWIDAKEYAVMQVKGQLSQRPSFWVHQPEIEQRFEKIQSFWLPSYNRSVANITFVGETSLTIEYSNYKVKSCQRQ
jgi:hypothetical protein